MQQGRKKDDVNMSLVKMIATRNIEELCSIITDWLKQHYNLDGVGFFSQGTLFNLISPFH